VFLDSRNIDISTGDLLFYRDCRGDSGALSSCHTAYHLTGGGMGLFITGNGPSGDQKVIYFLRQQLPLQSQKIVFVTPWFFS